MKTSVNWPEGKQFAFSVFDDTDLATFENVSGVYALLKDCGFRTTKSCWVFAATRIAASMPETRWTTTDTAGGSWNCKPPALRSAGTAPPGTDPSHDQTAQGAGAIRRGLRALSEDGRQP